MMSGRQALTDKIIVLGVDGLEPSLAKKYMDQGKMPNLQKLVDRGAGREDLVLLGAMPTVTPPQWTTLVTGCYPATHGITAFFNPHPEKIGTYIYALDSRLCLAEPVWNVFAEAGKKTMVWHWPGSSWPPTSDNPNLHVVDGTQPGAINMGTAVVDWETIILASEDIQDLIFTAHDAPNNPGVGCVITNLDAASDAEAGKGSAAMKAVLGGSGGEFGSILMDESDSEISTLGNVNLNMVNSPIKPATGWAFAPEGAKEFTILVSEGFVRRPALLLKNEQGIYDRVAVYKSKKDTEPIIVLQGDEYTPNYVDDIKFEEKPVTANRNARLFEIAADGSKVRMWLSVAYDIKKDNLWHPRSIYQDIITNVSHIPPISMATGKVPEYAEKLLIKSWDYYSEWQADALLYLMERYEVIFSHLHNVDLIGHQIWHFGKHRAEWGNDEVFYQGLFEEVYKQTDRYLGRFVDKIDEGWTIIVTSDHGLITEEYHPPGLFEGRNNGTVMVELGYTVLKQDAEGKALREIDWTKTKAICNRGGHIQINTKGRYPQGIVEPEDQYALEEKIISDLYNYREPHTGRRVVAMALRNKDAAIIGMNGSRCGDIVAFAEEGFNIIHMDSLSTQSGYLDTSVSPIFLAAGPGIKQGFKTNRVIRQVDVAPTIAVLGGVRMPRECEGAPAYQILSEEY